MCIVLVLHNEKAVADPVLQRLTCWSLTHSKFKSRVFCFFSLDQSFCFKIFLFFFFSVAVDILAVLLTDVLLLLQEKDQKYTFASVVGVILPN